MSTRSKSISNAQRIALILGIGGQDGYFAAWSLHDKGYKIIGVLLKNDLANETIPCLPSIDFVVLEAGVCEHGAIRGLIRSNKPALILNFAGISFIPYSWEAPIEIEQTNGYAVGKILQIVYEESPESRFFQACSSEMFGHSPLQSPQDESTPFSPDNPYGSSKVFAYHLTKNYREHYGLFACSGILYNHESEWRPKSFVSRKITAGAASIKFGLRESIVLGDLDAERDWSYAFDIVNAIILMLEAKEPFDLVIGSGRLHSVKDILDVAFSHLQLDWKDWVNIDDSLRRHVEPKPLCSNPCLARKKLGWRPLVTFEDMIVKMVDSDLERLQNKFGFVEKIRKNLDVC